MNSCSCCGSTIPDGQSICSMCMGDMSHGTDGYYEEWAREQMALEEQAQLEEERWQELNELEEEDEQTSTDGSGEDLYDLPF